MRRSPFERLRSGTLWMWLAWALFWILALWIAARFEVVERVRDDGFARDPDARGLARQVST